LENFSMDKNICIFGDSITWGAYDPEGGGWANRLRNYYELSGKDITVYNLGISGDNSGDLLERIEIESRAREPEIIIISIGINDSQFVHSESRHRIPIEQFISNLENLYKIANKYTQKVVFIGLADIDETKTTPIPWDKNKSYKSEWVRDYDHAINEFCANRGLMFISMEDIINKSDLEDGLHPNAVGHKKIFQRVRGFLTENNKV